MKIKYLLVFALLPFFFTGCNKDDDSQEEQEEQQLEGDEDDIANFVSQDILDVLIAMDFVIHTGNNPPILDGNYEMSPRLVAGTNIDNDYAIGTEILPTVFQFSNQNNTDLTFDYREVEGNDFSESIGDDSFISGSGDLFSAFVKTTATVNGESAILIIGVSGKKTDTGFTTCQQALFMLDNKGNPNDLWIDNNKGRIFEDEDGLVEVVTGRVLNRANTTLHSAYQK